MQKCKRLKLLIQRFCNQFCTDIHVSQTLIEMPFFFYCLAVVMVMDNPNSYARPIKHLEKGMDFGVSSNCFLVSTIISSKGIMINAVVEGKL